MFRAGYFTRKLMDPLKRSICYKPEWEEISFYFYKILLMQLPNVTMWVPEFLTNWLFCSL